MIELAENRYGKSRIRLMKVTRHAHGHDLREWTVQVLLKGDFVTAHLDGDNSKILPTDTMKNTVYSLARASKTPTMEDYAKELVDFLLGRNPQVSSAGVRIESTMWKRLTVDDEPHPSAFMRGSNELQTTNVERAQGGSFHILSGLDNLVLLKTANSAFEGYIKDSLTTLPRNQRSSLRNRRHCRVALHLTRSGLGPVRTMIREAMLRTFANHNSKSVQQTPLRHGRERTRSRPCNRRDRDHHAQQALPSRRPLPASTRTTPTRSSFLPTSPRIHRSPRPPQIVKLNKVTI